MLGAVPRGAGRCVLTMCAKKVYVVLLLVPYVFLLLVFHVHLQIYDHKDHSAHTDTAHTDGHTVDLNKDAGIFRFRELMLNKVSKTKDDSGHQVEKPELTLKDTRHSNSSRHTIKVSRTFQNGTRLLFEMGHDPTEDAVIRLELDRDTINKGPKVSDFYSHKARRQSDTASVTLPFTEQCWQYYDNRSIAVESSGTFRALRRLYILSAYLDFRIPDDPPFVRMMVLLKRGYLPDLYCHFPYQSARGGDVHATEIGLFYEMCENHNKEYGGWIVSCKVPSVFTDADRTPCEVVVSEQPMYTTNQAEGGVHIPIFTTEQTYLNNNTNNRFAVCVPPLFGHIPSTTLVEFIELSRLLGANHVVFYAYQVTSAIQKVLDYYQDQGLVTVISWELPVRDKSIWYNGQLLAINDCLYRTMHRFTHVVFNDIDEFLVPHKHSSWADMAHELDTANKTHPKCGYTFQSAFFDPLVNGNNKILYDVESDLRTKTLSVVRSKAMVRPRLVFELGIHHISRPVTTKYDHIEASSQIAFIHHYRKCMMDFDPHMKCHVYTRDETLSKFIPSLRHIVHESLWVLKELDRLGRT